MLTAVSCRKNANRLRKVIAELSSIQRSVPTHESNHAVLSTIIERTERLQNKMMREVHTK